MKLKTLLISSISILIFGAFTFKTFHDHKTLRIGTKAPMSESKLDDVSGEKYSLTDIKMDNGLLVIFSSNTCPFVIGGMGDAEGWESRYNQTFDIASKNNIGMALINSNEAKRDNGESMNDMVSRAKEKNLTAKYLLDENSKLADAFGARTTPHVFLFNKNMELVYVGAIDDNVKSSKDVKEAYLEDALKQIGSGEKITNNTTRNTGCSIKRIAH